MGLQGACAPVASPGRGGARRSPAPPTGGSAKVNPECLMGLQDKGRISSA